MKKTTLIILVIMLMASFIPRPGQAQTISDMIAEPLPSMLSVVSSRFDDKSNYILINWKIANVEPDTDPVDIYLFLKSADNFDTYFIKIDFVSLLMGKNIMETITAVNYESKFLDAFDLNDYLVNGDLIVEMFPVDVSTIPNIIDGKYLICLAVVDPSSEEILSSTVDMLMVKKPMPGPGPNGPYVDPNNPDGPYIDPNNPTGPYIDPNNPTGPYIDPNNPTGPYIDPNNPTGPYIDPNNPTGPYIDPNNPTGPYIDPNNPTGPYIDPNP
jgi:hypothetical protein